MSFEITRPNGEFLRLDRTDREAYDGQATVTEHPVEDGTTTTDHIQVRPLPIVVEGVITESPYDLGEVGVLVGLTGAERTRTAREFLRSAQGEIVSVQSLRLGTFSSLALVSFRHTVGVLRELRVVLAFREVRIAEVETVIIPPTAPADAQATGAPDGQDAGNQTTTDTEGEDADRDASAAYLLLEGVGVF